MVGQIREMTGEEVQIQGVEMDQIHLAVIEIITRKENVAEILLRFVKMSMIKKGMAEIETGTDTGHVIAIVMSVMVKIGTEIVMIVIMIKIIIEKEIIEGHVTETMIKIGIVVEDMIEIGTGTTTTRIAQDIVENGAGRKATQRIITVMKLYTHFLSFLHVI